MKQGREVRGNNEFKLSTRTGSKPFNTKTETGFVPFSQPPETSPMVASRRSVPSLTGPVAGDAFPGARGKIVERGVHKQATISSFPSTRRPLDSHQQCPTFN